MPIQNAQERPDLYDSYDLPEREFEPSAAYREATMPSWMREAIIARAHQHEAEADSAAQPIVSNVQTAEVVERVRRWPDRSFVTVVSFPDNRAGDIEQLRKSEISALRNLADQLERNHLQPGPLIVDIPGES